MSKPAANQTEHTFCYLWVWIRQKMQLHHEKSVYFSDFEHANKTSLLVIIVYCSFEWFPRAFQSFHTSSKYVQMRGTIYHCFFTWIRNIQIKFHLPLQLTVPRNF